MSETYKGLMGVGPQGAFKVVDIPNANTKDCQYNKTTTDPRCQGCSHSTLDKAT